MTESRDHRLSLDQECFGTLVSALMLTGISKGKSVRDSFVSETDAIKLARRSIVSTQKIPKGTIITREMVDVKRPATGLAPKLLSKVIGAKAVKDIQEDVPIQVEYLSM